MKDDAPKQIECRLWVDGKLIEFQIPGPLVTMRPVGAKAPKGKGGKA